MSEKSPKKADTAATKAPKAEKQGFQESNPVENWIQAEAQIDAMLTGKSKLTP